LGSEIFVRQHHPGELGAKDRPHVVAAVAPEVVAVAPEVVAVARSPLVTANVGGRPFRRPAPQGSTGATLTPAHGPAPGAINVLTLEEFVTVSEFHQIVRYALEHESSFQRSLMLDSTRPAAQMDETRRKSAVLFHLADIGEHFKDRITSVLPYVVRQFGWPALQARRIDIQITATNDDEYFRPHVDNFSESVRTRRLSFVYFFHREPKHFTGGDLRIFDLTHNDPVARLQASFTEVSPAQNQIAFFPSGLLHEIADVVCPTGAFMDSRFTLNGWIYE
jgi:SM-20-related protein